MKIFLIFTLIVQATTQLIEQILPDPVNFIVHTSDIKHQEIYHHLQPKEAVKLPQLSTSCQGNFKVCLKKFGKCSYTPV